MSETTARRALSVFIAGLVLLSALVIAVGASYDVAAASSAAGQPASVDSPLADQIDESNSLNGAVADEVPLWKIDPELRRDVTNENKGWSLVDIRTVSNRELVSVLNAHGARLVAGPVLEDRRIAPIAFRDSGMDGIPMTQRVWVPNSALGDIASLDGVISVGRPLTPRPTSLAPIPEDVGLTEQARERLRELLSQGVELNNYPSIVEHGSLNVTTDLGVAGDGIRIAIVDTTVDFGHPNLVGRWAVNADTGSPYFGWPILLDTGTALDNLALFTASSDFDRFPYPFFSSLGTFNQNAFADMHYEIADSDADGFITYQHGLGGYAARADPTGVSGVVNNSRILRDYYVGTPVDPARITSTSGTFRLGILKDDFLTAFYGERIGILLVDSTTAGVYDTAYADLDFDFDFTNENAANQASPLLLKDLNADGIADISGGIVYFISNAATAAVVGEVVTPVWDAENGTTAQLANENLTADILPTTGLFGIAMELPTLYLDGEYWPSAGEDIWEVLIDPAVGNEKGTTTTLTAGENALSGAVVDTAALLADYNISHVYEVFLQDAGACAGGCSLSEGTDYDIDVDTGEITWLRNFEVGAYVDIIYEFDTWRVDFASGRITFSANATAGSVITANYRTGYPVPYADTLASRHGYDRFVPAAGDLLGVYGAYNGESHGTGTASTAAGNPVGVYAGDLDIYGQAPSATVISAEMFKPGATIDDAWYFAVEGPDGVPGTGDEAHISSNSWGWIDLPESGWEYESRFKYWLNTEYAPGTIFVQSTGNEGQGYATESSPTAPTSVQVGAGVSADIYWLFQLIGALPGGGGGDQHTWPFDTGTLGPGPYGDIAPFSSRGPNALGQPGPDVLAIGHGGLAGIPTNSVPSFLGTFDGQEAWDLFGGTSMSAPIVAGILALMLDGYAQAHGGAMPSAELAISVLKTTADDVMQETISQGAGWANAFRAVKAMMDMEGVVADVHEWVAGDYGGVHRDMFVNLLRAGASNTTGITLTNRGTSAATVSLSDGVYQRTGTYSFEWTYNNTGAGSLRTTRADFWLLNQTGVYRANDTDFPGFAQEQAADLATLWNSAAFMKVYTYSDPTVGAQVPTLAVYDWFDVNGNNQWDRFTEETYIGPIVFVGDFSETRVNVRTVHDPANRIHDGLGISQSALGGTSDGTPIPTTLYVEFYERVDWSVLSLSATTLNIAPGASGTVTATLTVPAGTPAGSYAGAIYYSDGVNTSTIQVLVNVPVTSFPTNLGGGAAASTLYENNVFSPGTGEPTMGDGRFYWFDTTALAASNRKMLYNLGWKGGSTSDAEILVFAPAAEEEPNFANTTIFGPHTFDLVASTKRNALVTDTVEPGWEFLGSDVMPGLFLVKLQALRTSSPEELFEANVGTMTVSPDEVRVSSNDLEGSAPVTISANVPLRVGTAVDGSGAVIYEDLTDVMEDRPVASYPYTSGPYITYLYNAPSRTQTTVIEETRAVSWSLTFHSGAVDVDMGIFYDANCDGTYTVADDVIGHIIGSTYNNPETATLDPPGDAFVPAGCYWVHAAGRDVSAGSLYDLSFETNVPKLQGLGIAVTQAESTTTRDLAVDLYGFVSGDFLTYLFNAPNTYSTEIPAGTIVATWSMRFHSGADDVDFGLFYDANCDGVYTIADDAAGTVAGTSANPEVITLGFPAGGCYWVHAAGFTVAATGGLFDLTLSLTKIGVSAYMPAGVPRTTIAPHTTEEFEVTWEFPSTKLDAVTTDFLFVSPGNAPFALTQRVAVVFSYDLNPPTFTAHQPAPGSVTADSTPGIFVQIVDDEAGSIANQGEIDQRLIRVWLDGEDITTICSITVAHVTNTGYPEGIILFTPGQPLLDGPHTMTVQAGDLAGNVATTTWTFSVDTLAPMLEVIAPVSGFATSAASVVVEGRTEAGAAVTVAGQPVAVDGSGQFSGTMALASGANTIEVTATDAIGHTARTSVVVVQDATAPAISLLRSSAGVLTNAGMTVVSGVVDEDASVTVAGIPATVRADGSFAVPVPLVEGVNNIPITATDAAGNSRTTTLSVTRDGTPPVLTMNALPSETSNPTVTVSGTVETGTGISFVTVNGQPVTVSGGTYSAVVALSFGANVVFVEATDSAGNRATTSAAVSYVPTGISTASVGLILLPVLTIVALLVGLAIGAMRARGGPPEGEKLEDKEAVPPAEEELPPEGGEL